jgi:CRP-like cAMP-binding protein
MGPGAGAVEKPFRNRILAALPRQEQARLLSALERVELRCRNVLIEPNQVVEHVHFVEAGVVSLVGLVEDGSAIETATVGHEGMVGIPVYLGAMSMAGQAFVQVAGSAWRMSARDLREEVRRGSPLAALLGRYTQGLFTQLAQGAVCNRKHSTLQRCARWMLATHERVGQDSFALPPLFLSQMLGVRQAAVTDFTQRLQEEGLVSYSEGQLVVLDREGLLAVSCECHDIIRAEFARMIEGKVLPSVLDHVQTSQGGESLAGDGAPQDD